MKKIHILMISILVTGLFAHASWAQSTVTWTAKERVTVDVNNDLIKTGAGNGWNAGAISVDKLAASIDGWVQFIASEGNRHRALGLSNGDVDYHLHSIGYAIFLHATGFAEVYESGLFRGSFGAFTEGDTFKIERINGQIEYKKNGTTFYTSTLTSEETLLVDASFDTEGGTIKGVSTHNFSDGSPQFNTLKVNTLNLPTDYKMSVAGKVICEGIKVQLNANWPDYVFDEGYELKSLPEVEAYINTHKHLPNIPPAEKVAASGVDLEKMNRLLMEKIEELTLHLIEQNKKIEARQKMINELKGELKMDK
ncbi:MAG: hypothetical protein ACPGJS_02025 [Flammeovirgaceae bacterium]